MISKKELLDTMNISYGQLYRWKREGLIPDEWFIKRSVSTGQETFFDENLIIPRIEKILELKDKYEFEEVKGFLNPNVNERKFSSREIILIDEIDPFIVREYTKIYNKRELSIIDVILIYIFSTNPEIKFDEYKEYDFSVCKDVTSVLYLLYNKSEHFIIIGNHNTVIDKKFVLVKYIRFEDIASIIAKKL